MPTKKPARRSPARKSVEIKAKTFAKNFEKEARVIKAEGKEFGSKI